MKIVVDSNILFTFFWKDSFTKGLLIDQDLEFFAPEISIYEIKNNKQEIIKKTKISDKDDLDFIALALKLNCEIWSNDPHLKEQNKVKVYTTSEFIERTEQSQ